MSAQKGEVEYKLRVPRNLAKDYYVMKLNSPRPVNLSEVNNAYLTRKKSLHGDDDNNAGPGTGAGSEYGKDKKEETKRKRRGYTPKVINKEDMLYSLRIPGKKERRFGGKKEGSILENSAYYILTQCADGVFEAMPIQAWYNFTPTINYHVLSSDDVEKEFSKRDKTINYHNMMLQKRLHAMEEKDESQVVGEKVRTTFRDNLVIHDDEEDYDDNARSEDETSDQDGRSTKHKKSKKKDTYGGKKKKEKIDDNEDNPVDTDEEEELDNVESKEFDYMSESSSNDEEEALQDEPAPEMKKDGKAKDDLNAGNLSDSEAEEEEEELTSVGRELKEILKREAGEDDSSLDEEDEDEDIDESEKYSKSALFMPGNDGKKKKGGKSGSVSGSSSSSRSNTPTPQGDSSKSATPQSGKKQSQQNARRGNSSKQTPTSQSGSNKKKDKSNESSDPSNTRKRPSSRQSVEGSPPVKREKLQKTLHDKSESKHKSGDLHSLEGSKKKKSSPQLSDIPPGMREPLSITEATIRRYLSHKPMTTTDLVKKFKTKKTGLTKEQTVSTIASILKKIGPERQTIEGKLYLSIKPSKK